MDGAVNGAGAGSAAEEFQRALVGSIDPASVARLLDGMSHQERVLAVRSTGRAAQRSLYEAVDGFGEVRLVDLVAPSVGDLETVRHYGKNTLPLFTHFEKRFCRAASEDAKRPEQLYGFNFQTMAAVTGPGYFVAREDPNRPEVLVDYGSLPPEAPPGWPGIRSNEKGLSRFVYGFLVDRLRRVSVHVTIGSVARKGKAQPSWFMLCREG